MSGGIVLAAGGTGGHVFPAQALAEELLARGRRVDVISDGRGARFEGAAGSVQWHRISAATPTGANPLAKIAAMLSIARGVLQAIGLLRRLEPAAVIGFGGYPSLPTMLAAWLLKLPRAIHEQNAVLGRVNRLLAGRVDAIATSFERLKRLPPAADALVTFTGNPVRADIAALAGRAYAAPSDGSDIVLLVFGGSQGASILSDVVPVALAALPEALRQRLRVVQQCRAEDLERVRETYRAAAIRAETETFYTDMPARLSDSQIIISRAGAGTVGELSVAGRPAILVPYAYAADDHQTANAEMLAEVGGAWVIAQAAFKAPELTALLADLFTHPDRLATAAAAAAGVARTDAAARLADLAERLAGLRQVEDAAAPQTGGSA